MSPLVHWSKGKLQLKSGIKLDICVQRTRMPPPSALSKMALWLRYWLLSGNYRSIKADLYNTEETKEGPCRSKRLAFSLQSNLGHMNMKQTCFHHCLFTA